MPIKHLFLLLASALALPAMARAQDIAQPSSDGFNLSGAIRLRLETIDGQARAGFNGSDTLIESRTQIALSYDSGPITLSGEMRDSRAYGGNGGTPLTSNEVDALELPQLNVTARLGPVLGSGTRISLQAGRFLLSLGSRRLVASNEYRNTVNAFTGLRADLAAPGGTAATLFYVLPQIREPGDHAALMHNAVRLDTESFDLVLWGGLVTRGIGPGGAAISFAFLHLGERDAPGLSTRDRSLDTLDVRFFRAPAPGQLDLDLEAIYQTGHISASLLPSAPRLGVSAWFVHAGAGYSLTNSANLRLSLAFDRASGDGPGGSFGRFDTLFGTRRTDFAPSGLYSAVTRANIMTPSIKLEATPSPAWDLMASYRPMWLADKHDAFGTTGVIDPSGRSGNFAGQQLDLRGRLWLIPKRLRLELDGALLVKGRFLREAPNAPPGRATRYLSSNLTISF